MDANVIINALKTVGLNYIGSLILIGVTFLLFICCLVLSLLLWRANKGKALKVGANPAVVATVPTEKKPVKKAVVKKPAAKTPPVKPTKNICGICGADLKEGEKHPCLEAE